jgi:Uma2 family endonuclease
MRRKREEYFTTGVRLVWMIDPATRSADVYTAPERKEHVEPDGVLKGGDVLPGFEVQLKELSAAADKAADGR